MAALSLTTKGLTDPKGGAAAGNVPEAGNASEDDTFVNGGQEVLVVDNTGATPRTITFKDKDGVAETAVTIAANQLQVIGPFSVDHFGNTVAFRVSHAELEVVPVELSGDFYNIITSSA